MDKASTRTDRAETKTNKANAGTDKKDAGRAASGGSAMDRAEEAVKEAKNVYRKIIWPDRQETAKRTAMVFGVSAALCLCISGWDALVQTIINILLIG